MARIKVRTGMPSVQLDKAAERDRMAAARRTRSMAEVAIVEVF